MLFLKSRDVHEHHRMAFDQFLQYSSSPDLTFENLQNRLQEFAICDSKIAKQILQRVEPGGCLHNAMRFRRLYEILPQLLPKHFLHIMGLNEETLESLECALTVQPWAFGFSSILTLQFNIHGCEASFKNFYHCTEIYSQLLDVQKDGLFIYEALKNMCRRDGHTFVTFQSLKRSAEWRMKRDWKDGDLKYSVVDWNKGLFFLEASRIIVLDVHQGHSRHHATQSWRETVKSDTRVYLSRFYFAEKHIADNLERLMFSAKVPEWNVQIDFESDHFERLRSDEDQMKAARLIAAKPVVVLSGKGGCGKTEVVGRVFAYAQQMAAQECLFSHCSITDEELVEKADEQVSLYYATNDLHCSSKVSLSNIDNCVLDNGNSNQISDTLDDYGKDKESTLTLPPTQNYIKYEEKESSVILGESSVVSPPMQNYIKHEESGLGVTLGTSALVFPPAQNGVKCEERDTTVTLGASQDCGSQDCDATDPECDPSSADKHCASDKTILLTAPTGKAAILLGRRSSMPGYTLHQVVFSYFAWKRTGQTDPWKFASVHVLIVDECSLVSVTIFHRVLHSLLTDAKLSKVVLLGDVNQLPSIEPGRFLADVYEALDDAGCSITLRTNHRSESQFIVDNAERILQQQLPIINPQRHFHQISLLGDRESEDNNRDAAVRRLLSGNILLGHERSQFVAFRRKDCNGINELCCKHYNDHSMMKCGIRGKQVLDFRPGDKVCCSRNAYVTDYTDRDSSDPCRQHSNGNGKATEVPRIRLCNGEIFFIKEMTEVQERGKTICYTVLSDLEKEIKVDLRELKSFCKLKHAWARTIHTFQGSETDALVYVVGAATSFQNLQHVYTAVTRGKQQVHILTRPSCLQDAIRRTPVQRSTSLKERIQVIIAKQLPQRGWPIVQEESRNTDAIPSVGSNSVGETSTFNDFSLDQVTPVKPSPPRDHNVESISGGKRKLEDPPSVPDGSPSLKNVKSLADSLLSPIRRQLSLNNV